jgi:membrane dipeptidase
VRHSFNPMTLIIDSHQDLAWNMINLGRDYTQSAYDIRKQEKNTPIPAYNGNAMLGWPQYQQGNIAIVFGTLYCTPRRCDKGEYEIQLYETPQEAHVCYRQNLDAYNQLTDQHADKFRLLSSQSDLAAHLAEWQAHLLQNQDPLPPVGIVILMEGADGIRTPEEVEQWYAWGVRIIGPAWAGTRYCGGTREPGPLTKAGFALLDHMSSFEMILDLSHMDHQSARQSLDHYPGQVVASHSNAEALIQDIPNNRHMEDETIRQLISRAGVMGIVPVNHFLDWHWRESGGRAAIGLEMVAAQIDHVCQMAGNTYHVGLGTDFDGGFGVEWVPNELDTIADLPKLIPHLEKKGYNQEDIDRILFGNWLRVLQNNLPKS